METKNGQRKKHSRKSTNPLGGRSDPLWYPMVCPNGSSKDSNINLWHKNEELATTTSMRWFSTSVLWKVVLIMEKCAKSKFALTSMPSKWEAFSRHLSFNVFQARKCGDYGYPNKTRWFFPMQSKAENAEGCCSLVHHGRSVSYCRVVLLGRDHNYCVLDTCFILQVLSIRVWDCQTTDHMGKNAGANLRSCGLIVRSWSSR